MIDYRKTTDIRLNTIVTEFNEYAYENVIVAICETRARGIDIQITDLKNFCTKYKYNGIELAMEDFFKKKKVTSYEAYCKDIDYGKKLAKPSSDGNSAPLMRKKEYHPLFVATRTNKQKAGLSVLIGIFGFFLYHLTLFSIGNTSKKEILNDPQYMYYVMWFKVGILYLAIILMIFYFARAGVMLLRSKYST